MTTTSGEEIRSMIHVAYEKRNDSNLTFCRILDICRTLLERIEAIELPQKPPGQNFATDTTTTGEKRLRTAILEVLDYGHPDAEGNGTWTFYEEIEQPAVSEDQANLNRVLFADAVIARARAKAEHARATPKGCTQCGGPRYVVCDPCSSNSRCCKCRLGGEIRTMVTTLLPQIKTRHSSWRAFKCTPENAEVFERQAEQQKDDIGMLLEFLEYRGNRCPTLNVWERLELGVTRDEFEKSFS